MPFLIELALSTLIVVGVYLAFTKNIGATMWMIALGFIALGVMFLISGPRYLFAFSALGVLMIGFGLKRVPENPPHVAIVTFWGRRIRILLPEGISLLADYFPFKLGANPVKVERVNWNFVYKDVRCRGEIVDGKPTAGPAVQVEVGITIEPDFLGRFGGADVGADRIIKYLNSGGEEGVKNILYDILGEETRVFATSYTWEQFMFLKAPLAASLIMQVSNAKLRQLPRVNGKISEEMFNITPADYENGDYPIVSNPLEYIFQTQDETERHERQREMEVLIRIVRENGIGDIIDLGIQIIRLNVVRIDPESAGLSADAEQSARERKQREGEGLDFDTEISLAKKYLEAAAERKEPMTLEQALERVRVNRGRAKEFIVRSSGNPMADAAAMFNNKD